MSEKESIILTFEILTFLTQLNVHLFIELIIYYSVLLHLNVYVYFYKIKNIIWMIWRMDHEW